MLHHTLGNSDITHRQVVYGNCVQTASTVTSFAIGSIFYTVRSTFFEKCSLLSLSSVFFIALWLFPRSEMQHQHPQLQALVTVLLALENEERSDLFASGRGSLCMYVCVCVYFFFSFCPIHAVGYSHWLCRRPQFRNAQSVSICLFHVLILPLTFPLSLSMLKSKNTGFGCYRQLPEKAERLAFVFCVVCFVYISTFPVCAIHALDRSVRDARHV